MAAAAEEEEVNCLEVEHSTAARGSPLRFSSSQYSSCFHKPSFFVLLQSLLVTQLLLLCAPAFSFSSGQCFTDGPTANTKPLATDTFITFYNFDLTVQKLA